MIIIELAYKLSLIATFSVISVFLNTRIDKSLMLGKILQGILFGSIVCIGMYHPFVFKEGIFFDGRSIVISLSTLFFGPVTGLIASLISIIYRIYLGGAGTIMGISVTIVSFLVGYYFYSKRRMSSFRLSWINLYLFGLLVHILMLGLIFTLPGKYILQTYKVIALTVIGIYPAISLFIGKILLIEEDNKNKTSLLKETETLVRSEGQARLKVLHESEERLRIALESTNVSIWDWDVTNDTWYISQTFYKLLGYEYEPGKQNRALWGERVHPEDRQILIDKLDGMHGLNEGIINIVFRIKRSNGLYCWMNIIGEAVEIKNNGEFARMTGVLIDISHSKNIEDKLKENEARYKAFFENSLDAILLTSPDGSIYTANPSACLMFGYTEQEIKDLGRNGLVDRNDPRLAGLLQDREKHKKAKGELTFIKKDGTRFETELTSAIFPDVHGEEKSSMIIRDVSENKKIQEEITRLNDRLNRLINSVKDLAAARSIADIQAVIRASARKLINSDGVTLVLREGDLCYYSDSDAIEPLWKEVRLPIEKCISGWSMVHKQQVVIEDIYSDPRINIELFKSTFVKSLYVVPIRSGSPIGAIANYWATNHIPSENEMRLIQTLADAASISLENIQLYNELEFRVDERTSQLRDANKELEAFSYTISHDLRAPLRGISAFTTILMDEFSSSLDPEAIRYCTLIRENTKRLGILVDDLLAFSRLGRKEINKFSVDMDRLILSVYNEITTPDMQKRIDFNMDKIGLSYCDESLIRQVWINLLSNAIKFTSRKEQACIRISCHHEDSKQVFCIMDNGVGFEQKYVSKLFGVFQRLHKERDFEGIGVGLAIVQRIIIRHGGEVWAEGIVDKGASIHFSLPLLRMSNP